MGRFYNKIMLNSALNLSCYLFDILMYRALLCAMIYMHERFGP
jgi:hypothetical protein